MHLAWGREDLGEATTAVFKYLQGCQVEERGVVFVLQETEIGFHGNRSFLPLEKE